MVFVDLPGFVERTEKRKGLYVQPLRNMVETALSTEELEAIMLVVDATTKPNRFEWNLFGRIVDALKSVEERRRPPCFLVLNKIDLLPACRLVREDESNIYRVESRLRGKKNKLRFKDRISLQIFDTLVQELQDKAVALEGGGFHGIHTVSALKRWGLKDLEKDMIRYAHRRPWEYSRNEVTSLSLEERATEIVRSHMFRRLNREVPYNSSIRLLEMYVVLEYMKER